MNREEKIHDVITKTVFTILLIILIIGLVGFFSSCTAPKRLCHDEPIGPYHVGDAGTMSIIQINIK